MKIVMEFLKKYNVIFITIVAILSIMVVAIMPDGPLIFCVLWVYIAIYIFTVVKLLQKWSI